MTPPSVLETGGGGLDVALVLGRRQVISDFGHTGLEAWPSASNLLSALCQEMEDGPIGPCRKPDELPAQCVVPRLCRPWYNLHIESGESALAEASHRKPDFLNPTLRKLVIS